MDGPLAVPQLLVSTQAGPAEIARQLPAGWLTSSEQARLDSMRTPRRRQEFLACRQALRTLLARVTETAVAHWRLDAPEGEPPALNSQRHGVQAAARVHLTLSHSGNYLACGLAAQPLGVDIEVESARFTQRDALALASIACSEHEQLQLRSVACAQSRRRLFLQWWSLKEAYFKCLRTGVDYATLQRIECRLATDGAVRPLAHARSWSGQTPQGQHVVLSACCLDPAWLRPTAILGDGDIAWHAESAWIVAASETGPLPSP